MNKETENRRKILIQFGDAMISARKEGYPLTRAKAERLGFTVDKTTYPWFGYKGPRFEPTDHVDVLTDREAEAKENETRLLDSFQKLVKQIELRRNYGPIGLTGREVRELEEAQALLKEFGR